MPNNNLIPLEWDEEAVRLLSLIAPGDEDAARIWWENYAPIAYQAILDAGILEEGENVPQTDDEFEAWLQSQMDDGGEDRKRRWWALGVLFFFSARRFLTIDGTPVPGSTVRTVLDRTLANARNDTRALCDSLRGGGVSLPDWQAQMSGIIKQVHMVSAVLARGGFGRMSPDDWTAVQGRVAEQLSYLDKFAGQIASGKQRLDGTLCRRMQLYLEAGRGTYHDVEMNIRGEQGFDEYRNLLGSAEHCEECVAETEREWVKLGELVPIGSRLCNKNCKCTYEYRVSAPPDLTE